MYQNILRYGYTTYVQLIIPCITEAHSIYLLSIVLVKYKLVTFTISIICSLHVMEKPTRLPYLHTRHIFQNCSTSLLRNAQELQNFLLI